MAMSTLRRSDTVVVLHAEDDPDHHFLAVRAFAAAGVIASFQHVTSGRELLDYIHREGVFADRAYLPHPDVILLDLNMPELDGLGALKAIREDHGYDDTPVIVFTSQTSPEERQRVYESGANAYLEKGQEFGRIAELVDMLSCFWEGNWEGQVA